MNRPTLVAVHPHNTGYGFVYVWSDGLRVWERSGNDGYTWIPLSDVPRTPPSPQTP